MPKFVCELGVNETLTFAEAGRELAREVADAIVKGTIKPYVGASYIWREIINRMWGEQLGDITGFIGLADDFEECHLWAANEKKEQRRIEEQIVEYSREFLQSFASTKD